MNIGAISVVPQNICSKKRIEQMTIGTNVSWKKWLLENLKFFLSKKVH